MRWHTTHMQKKANFTQLQKNFFEVRDVLTSTSLYTRRQYLFWKKKLSYYDVFEILLKENILENYNITPTSNDILPMRTLSTLFKNGASGHSATIRTEDFGVVISKAIGEGLERYFLTKPECSKNSLKKKSTKDMPYMTHFPDYLDEQRHVSPLLWDKKTTCDTETVPVLSLFSDTQIDIPAQYIFWRHKQSGTVQMTSQTTNGAAGHFSWDAAVLAGLQEEIQRDTFLMYWLLKKSAKRVRLDSIKNEESKKIIATLTAKDLEPIVLVMENTYGVPVFTTILKDTRKHPHFVSLAAGNDISSHENSVLSSLYEAVSSLTYNETFGEERFSLEKTYKPFLDSSVNRLQRITMWADETINTAIDFLISEEYVTLQDIDGEIQKNNPKDILIELTERVRTETPDIYVYTVSSPILKKIGYHVVKVIVPTFLQLHLLETTATLRSERLARELGKNIDDIAIRDFNPTPHPFP